MSSATYQGKQQDQNAGTTTYWFELNGEVFGRQEAPDGYLIVDRNETSIEGRDDEYEIIMALESAVTDVMRFD